MTAAIQPQEGRAKAAGAGVADASLQCLLFLLGEEAFALEISSVREIIQQGHMTPVPLMPNFVRGVINLRGAVVPVIDLHARFGRPAATLGKKTCIVIFDSLRGGERVELGLLVDAVSGSSTSPPPRSSRRRTSAAPSAATSSAAWASSGRASSSSSIQTRPSTSTRWPDSARPARPRWSAESTAARARSMPRHETG